MRVRVRISRVIAFLVFVIIGYFVLTHGLIKRFNAKTLVTSFSLDRSFLIRKGLVASGVPDMPSHAHVMLSEPDPDEDSFMQSPHNPSRETTPFSTPVFSRQQLIDLRRMVAANMQEASERMFARKAASDAKQGRHRQIIKEIEPMFVSIPIADTSESDSDAQSDSQIEARSDSQEPRSASDTESEPEPLSDSDTEPQSDSDTEPHSVSDPESLPETQPESNPDSESEPETQETDRIASDIHSMEGFPDPSHLSAHDATQDLEARPAALATLPDVPPARAPSTPSNANSLSDPELPSKAEASSDSELPTQEFFLDGTRHRVTAKRTFPSPKRSNPLSIHVSPPGSLPPVVATRTSDNAVTKATSDELMRRSRHGAIGSGDQSVIRQSETSEAHSSELTIQATDVHATGVHEANGFVTDGLASAPVDVTEGLSEGRTVGPTAGLPVALSPAVAPPLAATAGSVQTLSTDPVAKTVLDSHMSTSTPVPPYRVPSATRHANGKSPPPRSRQAHSSTLAKLLAMMQEAKATPPVAQAIDETGVEQRAFDDPVIPAR